jgi:P pilus assembly chaperone PapD
MGICGLNMKNLKSVSLTLILLLLSHKSAAIAFSSYRLLLDNKNPEAEFIISSQDPYEQLCTLGLTDIVFDENEKRVPQEGAGLPAISARNLFRYSPKEFKIAPGGYQQIRFKYRRKRTKTPAEYRSYLSFSCESLAKVTKSNEQTSIKPQIRYHLPVIVRTGDIAVEVNFSDLEIANKKVTFTLSRSGKRSIYGNLEVINNKTKKVIHLQKGITLPLEVTKKELTLPILNVDPALIDIQFVEDKNGSGDVVAKISLASEL